jgi:G3E family GTPase
VLDLETLVHQKDLTDQESPFEGVLRSKGFCWFAPTAWDGLLADPLRHDTAMYWSHAGKHMGIQEAGRWWGSLDEKVMRDFFQDNQSEYQRILSEDFVTDEFGDRRQEIVFIGVDLDQQKITQALNDCLLTEEDMGDYRQQVVRLQEEMAAAVSSQ